MRYSGRMEIGVRALRNETKRVLELAQKGEDVVITVDGRPVARLQPVEPRSPWISRAVFIQRVVRHQADSQLHDELVLMNPDTTDDVPL